MQKNLLALLISILALSPLTFVANATYAEPVTISSDPVTTITLSGEGEEIDWEVYGDSAKGFKVAWSKNENPTYPTRSGDKYHYHSSPSKASDTLTAFDGDGTYYVRVCEYLGGACGMYSNQITVVLGEEGPVTSDKVETITLESDGANISWTVDGNSHKGFKVAWSKNENPTYPTRSGDKYHYHSSPSKTSDTLTAFSGEGIYYVRVCEYLGGACGVYSNQVKVQLTGDKAIVCTMEYTPICGSDGKTYSNKCMATAVGVSKSHYGECEKDDEIIKIENNAELLSENKLDDILAELQELRSLVREQQNEIKYLQDLMKDVNQVTAEMRSSINSFITYGVDDNTKRLGEGERAAVMYSYKEAYGALPGTESELSDAIKIANGRFPSQTSEDAEEAAKERFEQIYKRIADMNNPEDKAAITVMAYGLRQRAENRNLDSERNGIRIFRGIYGNTPETTEEWNVMQAITYSGATRGVDSDGDLLTDDREAELGTDPNNQDTDGDGFGDGMEVANGFDPLEA